MLSQDAFYRGLTPEESADAANFDFDSPDALDEDALVACLTELKRSERTRRVPPADVIVVEGILILHMQRIREMLNMKIFVDTDDDVRLARSATSCRGAATLEGVIAQYTRFVKPAFDRFVGPSRRHADVIIPWAGGQQRHRTTGLTDFAFYADRLNRLVVEAGLGQLPFAEKTVVTPTGHPYVGVDFAKKLCGVSIIRSGESMEPALRACCQGIKIGKILIHRSGDRVLEDHAVFAKLPADIADRYVLLLDPIVGTGETAVQAVEVLLSKGVQENKILFLSLIMAPEAVHRLCRSYPRLKLLTTEIDEGSENYQVVPGVGLFGDRYFTD
ncbi:hypothetical protein QBZ16_004694 [Prototheca wickerhamii]|uniref:uracil phosphoribosyltransferase n=1 Tax=Prototheca wickerhamii TaxID=3111 RepID=A0AAD9IEU9_PROWI|nr:hypothetical protein QBZ16_004694 [Prototheca wickerhamii]